LNSDRLRDCKEQALPLFQKYKTKAITDRVNTIKLHIDFRWLQTAGISIITILPTDLYGVYLAKRQISKILPTNDIKPKSKNTAPCSKINFILEDTATNKIYFDYFIHYSTSSYFEDQRTHPYKEFFGDHPASNLRIPSEIDDDFYDPYLLTSEIRKAMRIQLTERYDYIQQVLEGVCEWISQKNP